VLRGPCATVVFALVTAAGSRAEANHQTLDLVVSPGITFSISLGAPRFVWAFGLECSVLTSAAHNLRVGGVAQAQVLSDGTFRFALATQGNVLFGGLELGIALRTGNDARSFAVAAHAAPFLSAGYAYVSYDFNLTLNRPAGVRRFEHFMHFGLKFPLGRYYNAPGSSYLAPYQIVLG
jgi:hypothetical protein